jgi:hypothetical protein
MPPKKSSKAAQRHHAAKKTAKYAHTKPKTKPKFVKKNKKKASAKKSANAKPKKKKPVSGGYSNTVIGPTGKPKRRHLLKQDANSDDDGTDSDDDFANNNNEYEDYADLTPEEQAMADNLLQEEAATRSRQTNARQANPENDVALADAAEKFEYADYKATMDEAKRQLRDAQAGAWGDIAADPSRAALACLKATSLTTYESSERRVIKAGFEWSYKGLRGYFCSPKVAKTVGNGSCASILSTYKLLLAIRNEGQTMDPREENHLRLILRARKNICPDIVRIVGAITLKRLAELQQLYETKRLTGALSEEDYQDLMDASTLMYCCALRIFQLRSLTADAFWFSPTDEKVAWVTVDAKVTRQNRFHETKLVHEDFRARVEEILARRRANTVLFPRWAKAEPGEPDAQRLKLEDLMKKINLEAANLFKWQDAATFHGTHNFRHGAAQDAFAKGGVAQTMLMTGHLSETCARHYARSDLERQRRDAFASLTIPKQHLEVDNFLQQVRARVAKARDSFKLQALKSDDGLVPYPVHAELNEMETKSLEEHASKQAAAITARITTRRKKRETKPKPDPYNMPSSLLICSLDQCTVMVLRAAGTFGKFYVPTGALSDIPEHANVDQAKQAIDRWRDAEQRRILESSDIPRQDLLNRELYEKKK